MFRPLLALLVVLAGVSACEEREVIKIAAAYDVPTSSDAERAQLLAAMQNHAAKSGYHVDYASKEDLALRSKLAPRKFSAAVWAGANDEEYIASAMNQPPNADSVWLSFRAVKNSDQASRFRISLMQEVRTLWPETKELPVLNGETIPLPEDLIVDGDRYILDPSAAERYNKSVQSPVSPDL